MASEAQMNSKGFSGEHFLKAIAVLGGGTAIFYALGFTVVQTFISKTQLEGMLSFSNEFYVDAGGKFLLEMIRAPLFAPYITFAVFFLLYFILLRMDRRAFALVSTIKTEEKEKFFTRFKKSLVAHGRLVPVWIILFLTSLYAIYYGRLIGDESGGERGANIIAYLAPYISEVTPWFLQFIARLFPSSQLSVEDQQSLAFFCIVTPVSIVVGYFLYRFQSRIKISSDDSRRVKGWWAYLLTVLSYPVFLILIPIAYGKHLYDWPITRVKAMQYSEDVSLSHAGKKSANDNSEIWFLGQFGDRYVFLHDVKLKGVSEIEMKSEAVFVTLKVDQMKSLSFHAQQSMTLRKTMDRLNLDLENAEEESHAEGITNDIASEIEDLAGKTEN